jgi:hypothetical protein
LDIRPNRSLPPEECCFGTSPSQVEKSRLRAKLSAGGAHAIIAEAQIGPSPVMGACAGFHRDKARRLLGEEL